MRPTLIELAVRVLRAAVQRAGGERIDAHDVQLALRCLLPHAGNRALLVEFWSYAGQIHTANRAASCEAVLQSIVDDLRACGRYPDANQGAAPARSRADQPGRPRPRGKAPGPPPPLPPTAATSTGVTPPEAGCPEAVGRDRRCTPKSIAETPASPALFLGRF